jgi:hypothetical protein
LFHILRDALISTRRQKYDSSRKTSNYNDE